VHGPAHNNDVIWDLPFPRTELCGVLEVVRGGVQVGDVDGAAARAAMVLQRLAKGGLACARGPHHQLNVLLHKAGTGA
jgi:hypothetical protein